MKFHPSLRFCGTFSIQACKHYNLSLSTFNENKQFTCLKSSMPGPQGPISGLRWPVPDSRGPFQCSSRNGPVESKVGKKLLVFIFRRWHTRPGGPFHGLFHPNCQSSEFGHAQSRHLNLNPRPCREGG